MKTSYTFDVLSRGFTSRIFGWKTQRAHHFLSKLELYVFYWLMSMNGLTDLREQYPLDRFKTLEIASLLGIKHPKDPQSKYDIVMTTDFLVNLGNKLIAINCKPFKDVNKPRIYEKIRIEKVYWEMLNVPFIVITERQIPHILVKNMRFLYPLFSLEGFVDLPTQRIFPAFNALIQQALNGAVPIKFTEELDHFFNFDAGTSMLLLRHLIVTKKISVDLNKPLDVYQPLCLNTSL